MAYVSKDKGWPQNILYGPNSSSFDEDKSIWIYCQVCMKEVKMRYDFKVSIYNEHVLSDSHRDTEVTQENSKTGETSPLKQSSMMSFISDTSPSVDGGSSSPSSASGKIQIDEFQLLLYQQ